MRLDCVSGSELGLKQKWVVYDIDTDAIWGMTYTTNSEIAWENAADRLGNCLAESNFVFTKYAIPREHLT